MTIKTIEDLNNLITKENIKDLLATDPSLFDLDALWAIHANLVGTKKYLKIALITELLAKKYKQQFNW